MKTPHRFTHRTMCLCVLAFLIPTAVPARAAALEEWPRIFVQSGVTNTIYQPQLDSWNYIKI